MRIKDSSNNPQDSEILTTTLQVRPGLACRDTGTYPGALPLGRKKKNRKSLKKYSEKKEKIEKIKNN